MGGPIVYNCCSPPPPSGTLKQRSEDGRSVGIYNVDSFMKA